MTGSPGSGIAAGMVFAIGCAPQPMTVMIDGNTMLAAAIAGDMPLPTACCAPNQMLAPMPPTCDKCGWQHTSTQCLAPLVGYPVAPRMSDADVDRIARRVVELLDARTRIAEK